MTKIIIALEGLPCSGKTTFFNKFKERNTDFFCTSELYIDTNKDEPSIMIRERYAIAEILKKKSIDYIDQNILLDRSFLSTLAFSYSKYKTTGDISDYIYNLKFMKENRQNIIIPDFVIVLVITPKESMRRRRGMIRDDTLDFWKNKIFLQYYLNYYYSNDLGKIIAQNRITYIDTMKVSEEETYKIIVDKIKETCK